MHYSSPLVAAAVVLSPLVSAAGLYPKSSAVLNVDGSNFDKLIKNSDKASIVEFYAPWCGHCQNLKPAYEKAAKNLDGLANIAAVNCDDEENKSFCGRMGIKGFPTLKTVRITGTRGKPIIQDYNGQRTAGGIVEAVKGLIPNVVKKITDDKLEAFLEENSSKPKALLFSDKGTTATLIKVLANEYSTNLAFAQIRDKEVAANEKYGITSYPTLIILPKDSEQHIIYDGKIEKKALNDFLSQYAELAQAPKASGKADKKTKTKTNKKSASSDSSTFAEASASDASSKASEAAASATAETLEDDDLTSSPGPVADEGAPTPIPIPEVPPSIETLETYEQVQKRCLGPKTQTCVLALTPKGDDSETGSADALSSLAKIAKKHTDRGDHLFPFFAIPSTNPGYAALKAALGFDGEKVEIIAVNGKRSWWKHHSTEKGHGIEAIEGWVDGIRFGEGKKEKLPEGLVLDEPLAEEPVAEAPASEETIVVGEPPVEEPADDTKEDKHDEL